MMSRFLLMSAPDPLIYLDNNATTVVDPVVLEEMLPFLTTNYGNPSSPYRMGKLVAKALDKARERVSALLHCEPGEIIFTSCGTESTNAAIHSALAADPDKQHIVTTRVEHSATVKTCERLAKKGVEITWLGVNSKGQVDLGEVERAVRSDTALLSVMWANNETGTLFPVETLAAIAKQKGVYFHTDAVQVVGKLPVQIGGSNIQFASISGHKLHGPKGVGALFANRRSKFTPFLTGGSQENERRAGTQNVASIVAFGKACEIAGEQLESNEKKVRLLRDIFEKQLLSRISGIEINGDPENRLPNTTNLAFENIEGEALLILLDENNIACSAGSACTAGSIHPSHVLKAMGHSDKRARSSLRFSFSHLNTEQEVLTAAGIVEQKIIKLRAL
jgi:cysteine desulfurase